jgi:hypothetical protein
VAPVASWLGGQPGAGWISLAVTAGFGLFLLLAGRSEDDHGQFEGSYCR